MEDGSGGGEDGDGDGEGDSEVVAVGGEVCELLLCSLRWRWTLPSRSLMCRPRDEMREEGGGEGNADGGECELEGVAVCPLWRLAGGAAVDAYEATCSSVNGRNRGSAVKDGVVMTLCCLNGPLPVSAPPTAAAVCGGLLMLRLCMRAVAGDMGLSCSPSRLRRRAGMAVQVRQAKAAMVQLAEDQRSGRNTAPSLTTLLRGRGNTEQGPTALARGREKGLIRIRSSPKLCSLCYLVASSLDSSSRTSTPTRDSNLARSSLNVCP